MSRLKHYNTYTSEICNRDTRPNNSVQLYIPKSFRKSFMYSGTVIWNSLPLFVKNASSVNSFKSHFLKWKWLILHLCVFCLYNVYVKIQLIWYRVPFYTCAEHTSTCSLL